LCGVEDGVGVFTLGIGRLLSVGRHPPSQFKNACGRGRKRSRRGARGLRYNREMQGDDEAGLRGRCTVRGERVILQGQTVGASTAGVSSETRDPPSFDGVESDVTDNNLCATFDIVVVAVQLPDLSSTPSRSRRTSSKSVRAHGPRAGPRRLVDFA